MITTPEAPVTVMQALWNALLDHRPWERGELAGRAFASIAEPILARHRQQSASPRGLVEPTVDEICDIINVVTELAEVDALDKAYPEVLDRLVAFGTRITAAPATAGEGECPSCHGLNLSCPDGCGRDTETGELNGTRYEAPTPSASGEAIEADERSAFQQMLVDARWPDLEEGVAEHCLAEDAWVRGRLYERALSAQPAPVEGVGRERYVTMWRKTGDKLLEWDHYVSEDMGEVRRVTENLRKQGVWQWSTYSLGPKIGELSAALHPNTDTGL